MGLLEQLIKNFQNSSYNSVTPYPVYNNERANVLPRIKDFAKAQKDYIFSKQFPIDVTAQNVGLGLGAAAGTPFGLTIPGAIAGGAIGGFVGNRIKESQGYPQTLLSAILDTATGAIPGNIDNSLVGGLGLYAGKKAKGFPRTSSQDIFSKEILNDDFVKMRFGDKDNGIEAFVNLLPKENDIAIQSVKKYGKPNFGIKDIVDPFKNNIRELKPNFEGIKYVPLSESRKRLFNQILNQPPELKGQFSSIHDKLPRFEIDDSGAKFVNHPYTFYNKERKLKEVLDHPELYKNYPDLENLDVSFPSTEKANSGFYDRAGKSPAIRLSGKTQDESLQLSNLLHEVQHAIQDKEGFAIGQGFELPLDLREQVRLQNKQLVSLFSDKVEKQRLLDRSDPRYKQLQNDIDQIMEELRNNDPKKITLNNYLRQTGEIEARDVQSRIPLMGDQRFFSTPLQGGYLQSQGIPTQDFITRF